MLVIDASAMAEALVRPGPASQRIHNQELLAPHLIDVEVARTLRRWVREGRLDEALAAGLILIDAHFEITRYTHAELLPRAWELRHNLSMYDAVYVALAEAFDVPLVTYDARLVGVPGPRCVVEVLPTT